MSNQRAVIDLIKRLSGQSNVLTIPRIFIHLTGDIKAALFLNQCIYWSDKTKREDGFFYKTAEEWEEETGLSRTEQVGARKKASEFVDTKIKRANGAPTLHYRVDFEKLANSILMFSEIHKTSNSENPQNELQDLSNSELQETSKTLTEITQEITSGGAEKSAKQPKPKKAKLKDERLEHPAIKCAHAVGGKFPPKELWDDIIKTVGDSPDGEYMAVCRKEWVRRGYNPNAWTWLTEWYVNHSAPVNGSNGKQNGRADTTIVTPAPAQREKETGVYL
jgi:hypothetical protein